MSQAQAEILPDIRNLVTEDDEPVDNLFSETQQRLLTEPLYSSWSGNGRTFLAAANVGVFYLARRPAIVPDVMLSLDVEIPEGYWSRENQSYFLWEFGKPPDLVIEVVSKTARREDTEKKAIYARMRVGYYVIFDPNDYLMPEPLTVYRWNNFEYEAQPSAVFPALGLSLALWEGEYERKFDRWLRWADVDGKLIPTGKERAEQERLRADRLAEMLRQLGKDPNSI